MNELKTQIETFRGQTELVITGLDRFVSVMQAITDVKNMAIQAEVQFLYYQECFRTMRTYGIVFPSSDEAMAYDLQYEWESLYLGALYRTSTLESTSEKFAELTREQIQQFLVETTEFSEDFETHGPGSIGDDLEFGLKKMDVMSLKKIFMNDNYDFLLINIFSKDLSQFSIIFLNFPNNIR